MIWQKICLASQRFELVRGAFDGSMKSADFILDRPGVQMGFEHPDFTGFDHICGANGYTIGNRQTGYPMFGAFLVHRTSVFWF